MNDQHKTFNFYFIELLNEELKLIYDKNDQSKKISK